MRDTIIRELETLADSKYRDFHLRTCPQAENLLGVRMPDQRRIAKRIARDDFRQFLAEARGEYYEEIMIEGIVIMTAKMNITERLERLGRFVPRIQNWAICDCVAASLKLNSADRGAVWDFLQQFRTSKEEYEVRFMLVMMLDHFIDGSHLADIFRTIDELEINSYYVEMAEAWLVAEAMVTFWEETIRYLKRDKMSSFAHNKAIQKARESYRIALEDKTFLLQLKR